MTPLDIVKCNMQVDPVKFKSIPSGFGVILKEQGAKGLFKGWAPTLFGYSAQGAFKFGLYEFFKKCAALSRLGLLVSRELARLSLSLRALPGTIPTSPARRTPPSTRPASTSQALPPLNSLPTSSCARSRPSRCVYFFGSLLVLARSRSWSLA